MTSGPINPKEAAQAAIKCGLLTPPTPKPQMKHVTKTDPRVVAQNKLYAKTIWSPR